MNMYFCRLLLFVFFFGNLSQSQGAVIDKFTSENVESSAVEILATLPKLVSEIHCAASCAILSNGSCHGFYLELETTCTLIALDPMIVYYPNPTGDILTLQVSSKIARGLRCTPERKCGLGGGACFDNDDCRIGLVCGTGICQACGIVGTSQSSVHDDNPLFGPSYAMDSITIGEEGAPVALKTSVTKPEVNAWWQVEYACEVEIANVLLTNNPIRDNWLDYGVYVSNVTANVDIGSLCGVLTGPSWNGRQAEVQCSTPSLGRFLIIQNRNVAADFLQLNEINVFGPNVGTSIQDQATITSSNQNSLYPLGHATDKDIRDLFTSKPDDYPWVQFEFDPMATIAGFLISLRTDCCTEMFTEIGFYVGQEPAQFETLTGNPLCALYQESAGLGEQLVINCFAPMEGKYAVVQKRTRFSPETFDLSFNEIVVFGQF